MGLGRGCFVMGFAALLCSFVPWMPVPDARMRVGDCGRDGLESCSLHASTCPAQLGWRAEVCGHRFGLHVRMSRTVIIIIMCLSRIDVDDRPL